MDYRFSISSEASEDVVEVDVGEPRLELLSAGLDEPPRCLEAASHDRVDGPLVTFLSSHVSAPEGRLM